MKKTLAILLISVVAVGAFAQGKVTFGNDASRLITVDSSASVLTAAGKNAALAGLAAPQVGAPLDVMSSLTAQLWGGVTAGALTLQSTLNPAGVAGFPDGRLQNVSVTLTGIPAGAAFFQILIFETSAGNFAAAQNGTGLWYASTAVFGATAGGFAPTPLTTSPNWAAGPITLTAGVVPEPSTFVLAGLGVASLLLFRRRK